jgi:hypothetical protein
MRHLLRQFGSVPLVQAAYNSGPTRFRAAVASPADDETPGYVPRVLGADVGCRDAGRARDGNVLDVRLVR